MQLFVGNTKPSPELFKDVHNYSYFPKPKGGLWTSTYNQKFGSEWIKWRLAESLGGNQFHCWLLEPKPNARIYTIDGLLDLHHLHNDYPDPEAKLPFSSSLVSLNWERIKNDYDAVRITELGEYATRYSNPSLYGWDCESTIWLRWSFRNVTDIGLKEFQIDDNEGEDSDGI